MNLPISVNIPGWVNWVAQDEDGAWWGYSVEPLQQHSGWYENEVGEAVLIIKDKPNPGWKNTLSRVINFDNNTTTQLNLVPEEDLIK